MIHLTLIKSLLARFKSDLGHIPIISTQVMNASRRVVSHAVGDMPCCDIPARRFAMPGLIVKENIGAKRFQKFAFIETP